MKTTLPALSVALLLSVTGLFAQTNSAKTFVEATAAFEARVAASNKELADLRQAMMDSTIPLSEELSRLETELSAVRAEEDRTRRSRDEGALRVKVLEDNIEARRKEATYVETMLDDFARNFRARLHVVELQRYEEVVQAATSARERDDLNPEQVFDLQAAVLVKAIDRLDEILGGAQFEGSVIDPEGLQATGQVLLIGPTAVFRSTNGKYVGSVDQKAQSSQPSVFEFEDPADTEAAAEAAQNAAGFYPLDPSLGNARQIASIKETWLEHVQKGGNVMYAIGAMAAIAFLIALFKWVSLSLVPNPPRKRIAALVEAVGRNDKDAAQARVAAIKGPVGEMLAAGVAELGQRKELIEEIMYERMLAARLRLQRMLPFIAICAASAPLLGLLGTVTGIIETFKLLTLFGSSDVKSLSGGISAALITTEYGLIVAIPSLLTHAYLSRKAMGIVGKMEQSAIQFTNEISKVEKASQAALPQVAMPEASPEVVRTQVREIINEMLGPIAGRTNGDAKPGHSGAALH